MSGVDPPEMPPAADEPRVLTYGLWTNKGGVGKTTLTFHLSSLYAHLHPEQRVVLLDMCPQANLSHTVLNSTLRRGSAVAAELQAGGGPAELSRTVAGYLHSVLAHPAYSRDEIIESGFLTRLGDEGVNHRMPTNMWLLCGDPALDDMNSKLHQQLYAPQYQGVAGGPAAARRDGFYNLLHTMRTFFKNLSREPEWRDQQIVVFVDTNPAFTEYTQLALCTIDKLIVPVNADDFSLQAVDLMFSRVWNLFESEGMFAEYRRGNFAPQAYQRCPDLLPKLAVVVHNRHNVYNTRATSGFQFLHQEQGWRVYQAFVAAFARTGQDERAPPVFVDKGLPNPNQFPTLYTATVREMFSAGVAAAYTGVPLHKVLICRAYIEGAFNGSKIIQREPVKKLLLDLLKVLSLATDDPSLQRVNAERLCSVAGVGHVGILVGPLGMNETEAAYDAARQAAVEAQGANAAAVAAAAAAAEAALGQVAQPESDYYQDALSQDGLSDMHGPPSDDEDDAGPSNGAEPADAAGPSNGQRMQRTHSRN
ncbi:ATPase [Chlorella sorokiniana]|uniref:ATPase n=1 Tax=Chlorella sorokiniana TaxID=3076 RepID=A0A2P6TBU5_CHLSO|nr:ATPase [Chlorella sorokiniana]|eukprot:PRW18346.1 ATPase [Chlorella sorokiniana]